MKNKIRDSSVVKDMYILYWLLPIFFMVLISMYFSVRYITQWAETDSAVFAQYIRSMSSTGTLVSSGSVYPNGYSYQALATFIGHITGLSVTQLQQVLFPLLAFLVILPAWLMYREFTGSARGATLTTFLLFTQPEFLFVILRSSHEKFTRLLMLMALFWLIRSFRVAQQPRLFGLHVVLFYLTTYAFITSNNLLAHSFIFAIITALLLGIVLIRRVQPLQLDTGTLPRLAYAGTVGLGLAYLFTFLIYAPAQHDLLVLENIWKQIAALFLDVQKESANAYTQVVGGWISLPVYFMVSIANWVILLLSFVIWVRQGWMWVWKRYSQPTQIAWLLWLLYASFAFQGFLSVLGDASGAIGNLQHRIFPSFSIVAVAIVGTALTYWRPHQPRLVRMVLTCAIGFFAMVAVFKATNEPVLSNKWTFYTRSEMFAIAWSDTYLQNSQFWAEFDERLSAAVAMENYQLENNNRISLNNQATQNRLFVISAITRLRSIRLARPLPISPDALQIYDNGMTQVYRLRPETPFQK